ncbi:MAG: hypothetical protein ACPG9K_03205 [Poseidonibacter sp.]
MKFLLLLFLFINVSFANSENISRMNALKKVIQKEEYISLAINKYILQTGTIPKTSGNLLDWTKLEVDDYLGSNFNKTNPLTSKDMNVYYDTSSDNFFIRGVVDDLEDPKFTFDSELMYLYNFYTSRIFRVNTLAPINTTEEKLLKGSQIIYSSVQKEIVETLNLSSPAVNTIKLDSQDCTVGAYYYELKGEKLTYKYCKSDGSIEVYQKSPIYVESIDDLQYIKVKIGDIAYAKNNGTWYEYYYQGDTSPPWIPEYLGSTLTTQDEDENVEDLILSYIPDAKDLVFRQDGGCMLANGDIFCWGNNKYKKAGIQNYGQLDTSISADYVNTPVMLKVQIDDITAIDGATRNDKKWYNNPFRVKFEKMAMSSTNVCGISPIFEYSTDGIAKKVGGDLYCNGSISSTYFEDLDDNTKATSILKRNKYFTVGKEDKLNDSDEIYLQDIVLIEDTGIVLSDAGDIYTFGRNFKGALGIDSEDKFITASEPMKIDNGGRIFKKIFALRDTKSIGAIDEDNNFWIWGERPNGTIFYKPTLLDTSRRFNKDAIFVNTSEFVLKGVDNVFYKTSGDKSITAIRDDSGDLIPSTALSVSVYGNYYLYVNEDLELKGSDVLLKCMQPNEIRECTNSVNKTLFENSLNKLNDKSNSVNGKEFANFANTSIFKLDSVIVEEFEDFETEAIGWTDNKRTIVNDDGSDEIPVTNFLGNFLIGSSTSKTFSFPSYENYEVEVEFDFYEIDTWDYEKFVVELNDETFVEDNFIHDNHPELTDAKDTGESLQAVSSTGGYNDGDQRFHYKLRTNLDSNGDLKIKFSTRGLVAGDFGKNTWSYGQSLSDESWGIDNVHVKVKETNKKFVCAMTGVGSNSQMYCWGNTGRSIPVLSTSLYDIDKISSINKLFITQESEKDNRMSYVQYNSKWNNNEGNLFLKFPTYIGGFDYGFYFK